MGEAETVQQVTTWIQLIDKHMPTLYALAIMLVGGLLIYLRERLLKKKDFELSYYNKILQFKIDAHIALIPINSYVRRTVRVKEITGDNTFDRVPVFLESKDHYYQWYSKFIDIGQNVSIWTSEAVANELGFLKNYFIQLNIIMDSIEEKEETKLNEKTFQIGRLLQQELFWLSLNLEKLIYNFFYQASNTSNLFEASRTEMDTASLEKRLNETMLIKEFKFLESIAKHEE